MKVAIIGGCGRMGQWIARFLSADGKEVFISDRNIAVQTAAAQRVGIPVAANSEALDVADAVILSVPLDEFENVIREIAPLVKPGQAIIDISSVKVFTVEAMHRYIKTGTALGVHPMFGPGSDGLAGRRVVLTPTGDAEEEQAGKVRQYLVDKGAKVAVMSPAEHDHVMSIVLGLSHFIALASADTLLDLGKLTESGRAAGTTYSLLLTLVESVLTEEPGLYSALQMHLPGAAAVERIFLEKAKSWLETIENKDGEQFISRMGDLKNGFRQADPQFDRAYRDMYRLLDGR